MARASQSPRLWNICTSTTKGAAATVNGTLARTRFADDAEDVAIFYAQVDALERAVVAVTRVVHLPHVYQFNHVTLPFVLRVSGFAALS